MNVVNLMIIILAKNSLQSNNKKNASLTKSKVEKCSIEFSDIYN